MLHQNLLKKVDLASLKSHVVKLNIVKLKTVSTDLSKLNTTHTDFF